MQKLLLIPLLLLAGNLSAQEIPPPPPEQEMSEVPSKVDKLALEDFGNRVFTLLKAMDSTSWEEYIEAFITDEEIEQMILNSTVSMEKKRAMWDHPQRANLNAYCKRSHENLTNDATNYNLNWKSIELDSIDRMALAQNGIQVLYGKLLFWEGDTLFSVSYQAPNIGGKYCLAALEGLQIAGGRGGFGPPPPQEMVVEEVPEPEQTDIEKYGGVIERDEPPMENSPDPPSREIPPPPLEDVKPVNINFPDDPDRPKEMDAEDIISFPSEGANFPGGDEEAWEWAVEQMKMECNDQNKQIVGKALVELVIEKDGSSRYYYVEKKTNPEVRDAVLRICERFPKIKPGKEDGKAVRSRILIMFDFDKLDYQK